MADGIIPNPDLFGVMKRGALEHASSFQPRPVGGRRQRGGHGGDAEKHRRIRGQAYGAVSSDTPTFLIDNVVVLDGGLDPSLGDPTALIRVDNLYADSYSDNEKVTADFNPLASEGPAAEWEANQKPAGSEKLRLVRGKCTAAVAANDATFDIDVIIPLASGTDPRTDPESTVETLTIYNVQQEAFYNDEHVTAIYREDADGGPRWEVLLVERYRSIRGLTTATVETTDATFTIDNIYTLESGIDPRSNPANASEAITIQNIPESAWASGDKVCADYNVATGQWDARPNQRFLSGYTCAISGEISSGTASAPTFGDATIYKVNDDESTTSLGTKRLGNPYPIRAKGTGACAPTSDTLATFVLSGTPLHECSEEVVTEITCDEGELSYETETLPYVAVECPE